MILSALELEDNEDELIQLSHKLWLDGKDEKWFSYAKVDSNSSYDDKKVIDQDSQDKYFDSEPPSTS